MDPPKPHDSSFVKEGAGTQDTRVDLSGVKKNGGGGVNLTVKSVCRGGTEGEASRQRHQQMHGHKKNPQNRRPLHRADCRDSRCADSRDVVPNKKKKLKKKHPQIRLSSSARWFYRPAATTQLHRVLASSFCRLFPADF